MKSEVDRVTTMLISLGYAAKGLHGDMEQRQREETIKAFKKDLEIFKYFFEAVIGFYKGGK